MTLKDWNNLPQRKREQIVNVFYWQMSNIFKSDIAKEFHHSFNWKSDEGVHHEGKLYEAMLNCCKIDRSGKIKIIITI